VARLPSPPLLRIRPGTILPAAGSLRAPRPPFVRGGCACTAPSRSTAASPPRPSTIAEEERAWSSPDAGSMEAAGLYQACDILARQP